MIKTRLFSTALMILAAVLMSLALFGAMSNYFTGNGYVSAAQIAAPAADLFHNEPVYDSGWEPIDKNQEKKFQHNIGGQPDRYVVDLQFKDEGDKGVNQQYYGSNIYTEEKGPAIFSEGAYWYFLTSENISIYREINDTSAPEARVRIWVVNKHKTKVYLPVVLEK